MTHQVLYFPLDDIKFTLGKAIEASRHKCFHDPDLSKWEGAIHGTMTSAWQSLVSQVSGVWTAYLAALDTGVHAAHDIMIQVWVANTDVH